MSFPHQSSGPKSRKRDSGGPNRPISRLAKLTGSAFFFVFDCLWRKMNALVGRSLRSPATVLYYHSVLDHERNAFARQMDTILRLSTPVTARASILPSVAGRRVAITFDDAFDNVQRNAAPALIARKMHATIFVVADVLGGTGDWWPGELPESQEKVATAHALKSLPAELFEFGSHTLTHPNLRNLSPDQARHEIVASRVRLQQLLDRPIDTFSFPFGAFEERMFQWCRAAGYKQIYTTMGGSALTSPEEFVTSRTKADPMDWRVEFYLKVMGAYRWLPGALLFKNRLKSIFSLITPTNSQKRGVRPLHDATE